MEHLRCGPAVGSTYTGRVQDLVSLWNGAEGPELERLQSSLAECLAQAAEAHAVEVPAAVFVPAWAQALVTVRRKTPAVTLADLATDDLYLVSGVLSGEAAAVACYRALVAPELDRVLRRLLPEEERAEMRQDLEMRLMVGGPQRAAALTKYRGSGGVRAWTRAVATRAVIDARRKQDRRPREVEWMSVLPVAAEGEAPPVSPGGEGEVAVRGAMAFAFAQLSVRQRNILRQSVFHGLGIDALATLYGVHRATAARWLQRARTDLCVHMEAGFARGTGAATAEAASLLRDLRGQVDVSIRSFLVSKLESEPVG